MWEVAGLNPDKTINKLRFADKILKKKAEAINKFTPLNLNFFVFCVVGGRAEKEDISDIKYGHFFQKRFEP